MQSISRSGGLEVRVLTKEEDYLSKLEYENDEREIWQLSARQFRMWLYGLDPTDAMLLGGHHSFKMLCELKRCKWRFIWRLIWE